MCGCMFIYEMYKTHALYALHIYKMYGSMICMMRDAFYTNTNNNEIT